MDTLIELYDERAIENVLGPETFRPNRLVYLCPPEIASDTLRRDSLARFLHRRGLDVSVSFRETSVYQTEAIVNSLTAVAAESPSCALDVTGGNNAALIASGMFCHASEIPTFTYSRRKNRFYNIRNAAFADNRLCTLQYSVEEFFALAGGRMRQGRVDSRTLAARLKEIDDFFHVFLRFRRIWNDQILFFQRISQSPRDEEPSLTVCGNVTQKGERGSRVHADAEFLQTLQEIGFLRNLKWLPDEEKVAFSFADDQVRTWLRDVGSVLELYLYRCCAVSGVFQDIVCSAIVDWDGTNTRGSVSNEIDVVASRGIIPLFISCKACDVKTEALNELSILADRFGGKGAKSVIATTEPCNASARHRAAQLGIAIIDLEELSTDRVPDRLKVIMKVIDSI